MFRFRVVTLALAWAVIGLGCTDVSEPPDVPPVSRAVTALQDEELSTLQREWSVYAEKAPGFAGMFLDDDGNMVVRTTDMSQESVLRQAVQPMAEEVLASSTLRGSSVLVQPADYSSVLVQPADYSFAQLVRWHNAMRRDLRGTTGFASIHIDYEQNQVVVGFAPRYMTGQRATTSAVMRDNGIPEDVVVLEPITVTVDIGYGPPAAALVQTLRDPVTPLVGGLRVSGGVRGCTMTLNARWPGHGSNQKMWMTNAHCSARIGILEAGVDYYQPTSANGSIGGNAVDRLFSGGTGGNHGYADVTMQWPNQHDPNPRDAAVGSIAWTKGPFPYETNEAASVEIVHSPRRVVGQRNSYSGQQVFKTGATTGTTWGRITAVDVTYVRCRIAGEEAFGCPSGRWELREQYDARYWSAGGDSGSPVYFPVLGTADEDLMIRGQHWGRSMRNGNDRAVFSGWHQVRHMVELYGSLCYTVSCN